MTWTAFRTRGEILRHVSTIADTSADGTLPWHVEGVERVFADELDLLGALQLRWHTRLAGRIERELSSQPLDLEAAVVAAWRATARELPGIRAVIDRHRQQPLDPQMAEAMTVAGDKERELLAVMAGRAGLGDPRAAQAGAEIEARARESIVLAA